MTDRILNIVLLSALLISAGDFGGESALQAQAEQASAPAAAQPEQAPPAAIAAPGTAEGERKSDQVVAKAKWGDVTIKDIVDYYAYYLYPTQTVPFAPVVEPSQAAGMPAAWLDKLAQSYVIARASEMTIDAYPDEESKIPYNKQLDSWLLNFAIPEAKRFFVSSNVPEPTEEEISKYYERQKPRFFHPFEFSMRHIFLMTYEPYIMQKNETFEGVALRLLGDKNRAREILADAPGRPQRWVPPAERGKRFFKPEFEGESVLLPMSPEKIEKVRQRMEEIRARALKGEDFVKLAKEFSQAEIKGDVIGPLPSGVSQTRWMQAALIEAATKTPKGKISEVVATRHGYHLIKIEDKKEEHLQALDEVRAEIVAALKKQTEEKIGAESAMAIMNRPDLQLNEAGFAKAPDLKDEDVLSTVGLHQFTWKELKPLWEQYIGPGASRDQIIRGLRNHSGIVNSLTLEWADEQKLWERPDLAEQYKNVRTGVFGTTVNKSELQSVVTKTLTEDAIQVYYDEHKDAEYRMPLTGIYQILARKAPPGKAGNAGEMDKLRLALDAELASIKNINEYIGLAKRTNPPSDPGKQWRVFALTPLAEVPGPTGEHLRDLQAGHWSPAFIEADTVRSVAMIDRAEARYKAPVEVRAEIFNKLKARLEGETKGRLEQHWIEQSQYQFILKDDSTEAKADPAAKP